MILHIEVITHVAKDSHHEDHPIHMFYEYHSASNFAWIKALSTMNPDRADYHIQLKETEDIYESIGKALGCVVIAVLMDRWHVYVRSPGVWELRESLGSIQSMIFWSKARQRKGRGDGH